MQREQKRRSLASLAISQMELLIAISKHEKWMVNEEDVIVLMETYIQQWYDEWVKVYKI